jgi:hypothetical protein
VRLDDEVDDEDSEEGRRTDDDIDRDEGTTEDIADDASSRIEIEVCCLCKEAYVAIFLRNKYQKRW